MDAHTATPYRKQSNEPKTIRDQYGFIVADCQREEDADFLLRAANAHGDMLTQLRAARSALANGRRITPEELLNMDKAIALASK
jgi:hypothetical protein